VVKLHVLDTGRVELHRRQVDPHPRDRLRLPATLVDREWTDWLAVWTLRDRASGGLVVVDAGQDPNFSTSCARYAVGRRPWSPQTHDPRDAERVSAGQATSV
jgi:hypothetical protein